MTINTFFYFIISCIETSGASKTGDLRETSASRRDTASGTGKPRALSWDASKSYVVDPRRESVCIPVSYPVFRDMSAAPDLPAEIVPAKIR